MPDNDDLDLLLDCALATYADPGPDSGLAQRVVSTLAAERESHQIHPAPRWPRRRLAWAIAAPIAASFLLWISIARLSQPPSIQINQAHQVPPDLSHGSQPETSARAPNAVAHPALKGHDPGRVLKGHDFSPAAHADRYHGPLAPERSFSNTARVNNRTPLPKLAVFPTPQPLTSQERALAAVAAQAPAPLREALVAAQEQDNPPITIAAIHIPPIEESTQTQP